MKQPFKSVSYMLQFAWNFINYRPILYCAVLFIWSLTRQPAKSDADIIQSTGGDIVN